MQFQNLARLGLYNRILSLNLTGLTPAAATFDLPSDPVILEISAQGAEFILAPADKNALLHLPILRERAASLSALPLNKEILAASLELYLRPLLKQAAKELQTTITISGYGESFEKARFPLSFAFYLEVDELRIPFLLMCKNSDAVNNLLRNLDEIYSARATTLTDPTSDSIPVAVKIIAGISALSVSELESLEEGDALVIERFCLKDDRLLIGCNGYVANARIANGKVTLTGDLVKSAALCSGFSENKEAEMSEDKAEPQEQPLQDLNKLKLEVSFIVDRQVMSLTQLKELKEGSEIPLTNHDLSNVVLEVNGQPLASGRIIDLGDRFGFRILKKGN